MSSAGPDASKGEEIIHLGLKRLDEPALMEDYLEYYEQPDDGHNVEELVTEMRRNPDQFFNFGFNLGNYKSYMMKNIFMRMEKLIIKENMDKKGPDGKNMR